MLSIEPIGTNQGMFPLSVGWTNPDQVMANKQTADAGQIGHEIVRGIHLTGTQLLVGFVALLGSMGLVLSAVIKLWLFEP
jgi:hypothetical protein